MTILPLSFDGEPLSIFYIFPSTIWFSIFDFSIVESSTMFALIVSELPFKLLEKAWIHMRLELSIEHFHFSFEFLNLMMKIIIVVNACVYLSNGFFYFNLRHFHLDCGCSHCFADGCLFSSFGEVLLSFFQ